MCRGATEEIARGSVCRLSPASDACPAKRSCELCDSRATLYCQADNAYLCRKCDQWVHGANFLAQRHVRCLLCNTCQKLTQRYRVGVSSDVVLLSVVGPPKKSPCDDSRTLKRPFLFL